jgi:hypothetical protein
MGDGQRRTAEQKPVRTELPIKLARRKHQLGTDADSPVTHTLMTGPDGSGAIGARRFPRGCNHQLLQSMILSAKSTTERGILTPSLSAVCRLITNSNLIGCSTGMSSGFAPFRILST